MKNHSFAQGGRRACPIAILSLALLAANLMFGSTAAMADVPEMMNYQGYLRTAAGDPVNGPVSIRFSMFDLDVGGTLIWSETHSNVTVDEGLFHVILGTTNPLTEVVFDGTERWLETILAGEPPLTPRRQFLATPYAMRAVVADIALSGGEGDDDWTINGSQVYHDVGTVSIGTAVGGSQGLYVAGDVIVGGGFDNKQDGGAEFVSVNGQSDEWYLAVQNETTADATDFYIGLNGTTEDGIFHIEHDGDVGIGTTAPANKLTVSGDVGAETFAAAQSLGGATVPAVGGVYADNVIYAWAKVNAAGTVLDGYGVSSVTRFSAGNYEVLLERSLPAGVCATVTAWAVNDPVLATASTSSDRVDVKIRLFVAGNHNFQFSDYGFYIQVVGRPS